MNALSLWKELGGLSDSLWDTSSWALSRLTPKVDVVDENNHYTLVAELPGFSSSEVTVQVKDGLLELTAEKQVEAKKDNGEAETVWLIRERRQACYARSFRLPRDVDSDSISAEFKDGLLILTLPKREESKPKVVSIKAA